MLTESASRQRVLWLSTVAFTLLFNVWLMLGVLGIPMRRDLGLGDAQLEWLIAAAILSGAVLRLNVGIWADQYGGREAEVGKLLALRHDRFVAGFDRFLDTRKAHGAEWTGKGGPDHNILVAQIGELLVSAMARQQAR
jgi:hypothetical protein